MNKTFELDGWTDEAATAFTKACEQLNLTAYRITVFKSACENHAHNPCQPRPVAPQDVKRAVADWQITAALRQTQSSALARRNIPTSNTETFSAKQGI